MDTRQEKNVEKLAREYVSTVFGIDYKDGIRSIPEGTAGDCQVKDDINIDGGYIHQTLSRGGNVIATNDPTELHAHRFFLKKATGRVLISGLGLGNSLNEVLKNPDIDHVLVVESEQAIIDLVAPAFSDDIAAGRVDIVQGDIFNYTPESHFNCIYHAIWSTEKAARAAVSDRKRLKERFSAHCDWHGFSYISSRGGSREGAGRRIGSTGPIKPADEKRTIKKGIRYNPKEMELIKQACALSGKTESELTVSGALKEAIRIIYRIDNTRIDELVKKTL